MLIVSLKNAGNYQVSPLGVVVLDEGGGVQGQVVLQPLQVVRLPHGLFAGERADGGEGSKVAVVVGVLCGKRTVEVSPEIIRQKQSNNPLHK